MPCPRGRKFARSAPRDWHAFGCWPHASRRLAKASIARTPSSPIPRTKRRGRRRDFPARAPADERSLPRRASVGDEELGKFGDAIGGHVVRLVAGAALEVFGGDHNRTEGDARGRGSLACVLNGRMAPASPSAWFLADITASGAIT